MGHFWLKTRSNLFKNLVYTFSPIIMKVCQNVCLHESWTRLKMGHVWSKTMSNLFIGFALMKPGTFLKMGHIGSKTRSLGQIIEDPMLVT